MQPTPGRLWRFSLLVPAQVLAAVLTTVLVGGCDPGAPFSLAVDDANSSGVGSTGGAGEAIVRAATVPSDAAALRDQIVSAVNAERAKVGLPPLVVNESLNKMADSYAGRLIAGDFFGHTDPSSRAYVDERAQAVGYKYYQVGENLARGQKTVDEAMKGWLVSPAHRANILDPVFTEIGVSVRDGGKHGRYWVQEFGRPLGQ